MRLALLSLAVLLGACAHTGPAARAAGDDSPACTSDLECSPGDECIRPHGQVNGVCGHLVGGDMTPTTTINRHVEPCQNDSDCPIRSRCELTTSTVGVCVKL